MLVGRAGGFARGSVTATDESTEERALVCRVRDVLAALPLAHIVETMRPLPVAPLGLAPAFVLGVAIIRGVPTPVVDPGVLLGHPRAGHPTRFVTARAGARTVAIAVEEILGVRGFPAAALHALPAFLGDAPVIASLAAIDTDLVIWLRAARLVPDAVWRELEAPQVNA
jgi:purine-binding chemotaxis protein CheW